MLDPEYLIIAPFNATFWLVLILFGLILIGLTITLKDKSDKTKRMSLVIASVITFVWFILYKYNLSLDTDFNIITAELGGFNWWGELPFHLCNINMIMLPIGVLLKKKPILSMCFFVGPLGALMAIVMPGLGFSGYSILIPRIFSYYGTHFMIIVEGLLIVTLGLYEPKFKDIPKTILTTVILCCITFVINVVLRLTGLNPNSNYFFNMSPEGNPILEALYNMIPIPLLYVMPCSIILALYILAVTFGLHLKHIILPSKKRQQESEQ